jgi:hypothetical protein
VNTCRLEQVRARGQFADCVESGLNLFLRGGSSPLKRLAVESQPGRLRVAIVLPGDVQQVRARALIYGNLDEYRIGDLHAGPRGSLFEYKRARRFETHRLKGNSHCSLAANNE